MFLFRLLLAVLFASIVIYTGTTVSRHGINLVPEFLGAMAGFGWQGQFNFDFLTFLLLSGLWTAWRGAFSPGAIGLGLMAVFFGMMFLSAYLLYLSVVSGGDIRKMLLGAHSEP